jgi:hypothetical protein
MKEKTGRKVKEKEKEKPERKCKRAEWQKKRVEKIIKRGPLSLVSTTEELLDRKVAAPV